MDKPEAGGYFGKMDASTVTLRPILDDEREKGQSFAVSELKGEYRALEVVLSGLTKYVDQVRSHNRWSTPRLQWLGRTSW